MHAILCKIFGLHRHFSLYTFTYVYSYVYSTNYVKNCNLVNMYIAIAIQSRRSS